MRFGLRLNGDSGTLQRAVQLATLAEAVGFDYVWYCQDLFKRDAWVALTAIATATRRIRLGTCIVNPFSADPSELAMRAASLQELSGGRFVLGIGVGDPTFLDWVGRRQSAPVTGLREAIGLLRRLLRGEAAPAEGRVFTGWKEEAQLRFPIAAPTPIYIGGQGPRLLELMGELGDGALPTVFPPESMERAMAGIRAGAARAGRSLSEIDINACVWWSIARSRRAAQDSLRHLIAYYGPLMLAENLAPIGLTPADFGPIAAAARRGEWATAEAQVTDPMFRMAIYGDTESMVEKLRWLEGLGVNQINIGPPLGPDPEEALRLTGERVIPHFKQ